MPRGPAGRSQENNPPLGSRARAVLRLRMGRKTVCDRFHCDFSRGPRQYDARVVLRSKAKATANNDSGSSVGVGGALRSVLPTIPANRAFRASHGRGFRIPCAALILTGQGWLDQRRGSGGVFRELCVRFLTTRE